MARWLRHHALRTEIQGRGAHVRLRSRADSLRSIAIEVVAPGDDSAIDMKMAALVDIGKLGLVHRDITGPPPGDPFSKVAPSPTATYPSLWNHNARRETRLICAPDSQLRVRQGMEAKAADVWSTASRAHLNLDFRFNSQPLTVAITERKCVGGRAWPNISFSRRYALTMRFPSGVTAHWGYYCFGGTPTHK